MIERTVTISLDEYNELRDFKEQITNGNCAEVYRDYGWNSVRYYSNDDAVREICEKNEVLKNLYNVKLQEVREAHMMDKSRLALLEAQAKVTASLINDLREMSWFRFRKWKNSLNQFVENVD